MNYKTPIVFTLSASLVAEAIRAGANLTPHTHIDLYQPQRPVGGLVFVANSTTSTGY